MTAGPAMMRFTALVEARETGRARPGHMVELSRDAIARLDGDIRAFAHVAEDPAVSDEGPLAGIAIGIKDIFDTYDQPTTYGSRAYAGRRPATDAAIVALARRRGATIIGKTVTTEFAYFEPGATVNPHNHAHTPGGSSSGSAAAVAAGMISAAIGTQTGGSVIRPASFCGVAGYKPSYRLLPTTGMKHFAPSLDTAGLFAASIADVALFAERLTGRQLAASPVDASTITIGVYFCPQLDGADEAMRQALEHAAEAAVAAGFTVVAMAEPQALTLGREAHGFVQSHEAGITCGPDLDRFAELMSPRLREAIETGLLVSPQDYDDARKLSKRGRTAVRTLFDDVDVLLTPSAPGAAPAGLGSTGDPRFNKLWTLLGTPAVNIPGFRDADGLPLGIQAVARFGHDRTLLSVASRLEQAFAEKQ